MEKKVLSIVDYVPTLGIKIKGLSETVPHQVMSLREMVNRASFIQSLPDLAKRMEDGPDEDYDDDMPIEVDIADMYENTSYIGKVAQKIASMRQKLPKKEEKEGSEGVPKSEE